MIRLLACLLLFIASSNAFAACSGERRGQSGSYIVEIGDGGCVWKEYSVAVWDHTATIDSQKPSKLVPFDKVCRDTKSGFSCGKDAPIPMRGTEYQRTKDTNPNCPGEQFGERFTCVQGCTPKTPKYLYIAPYEC